MPTPVIAVVGPTAVGKTEVTLALARRLDAEVVSADSMQVYRGMDIGTAKPSPAELAAVPHHLINVVEPDQPWSVADWVAQARSLTVDIRSRGKVPLVSGGTPLYLEALFGRFPLATGARPDVQLRARLARLEGRFGPGYLHRQLSAVDPVVGRRVHPADLKRTIRALEVYLVTGTPLSVLERKAVEARPAVEPPVLLVGLWRPRSELAERIEARVSAMLRAGLVAEVQGLLARGLDPRLPALQAVGYKEVVEYLRGRVTLAEAARLIVRNTRRLAKRQMTWFRSDPRIHWIRAGMNIQVVVEDIVTLAGGKT